MAIFHATFHKLQLLSEHLNELMILLQLPIGDPHQILGLTLNTSTKLMWPIALLVLCGDSFVYLSSSYIYWVDIAFIKVFTGLSSIKHSKTQSKIIIGDWWAETTAVLSDSPFT